MVFSLQNDLPMLAAARFKAELQRVNLLAAQPIAADQALVPERFYGSQLEGSRKICQRLSADPYKIPFQTIQNIICLPCGKVLSNYLESPKSDKLNVIQNLINLLPHILEAITPIVEDYVRLGEATGKSDDFARDLISEGIDFGNDVNLRIIPGTKESNGSRTTVSFKIKQKDASLLVKVCAWKDLTSFIFESGSSKIDLERVGAENRFSVAAIRGDQEVSLKEREISPDQLARLRLPLSFQWGGFVNQFFVNAKAA